MTPLRRRSCRKSQFMPLEARLTARFLKYSGKDSTHAAVFHSTVLGMFWNSLGSLLRTCLSQNSCALQLTLSLDSSSAHFGVGFALFLGLLPMTLQFNAAYMTWNAVGV